MLPKEQTVPVTYVRGGTSKALFFHEQNVPPPGPGRDAFLLRMMGSPDPMQIDGMGGSHVVTSKIAIIAPSARPDADVDYTFCQVSIDSATVGYTGNCGNISAGVGPFAIDEGLLKTDRPGYSIDPKLKAREVRIYNTGTKKVLISHVPVDKTGLALEAGDFAIAGCPGTAAPILMDFKNVVGATLGGDALPTTHAVDTTGIGEKAVSFTVCDVGNMCIFAHASDFGITGAESPKALDSNSKLIAQIKELRGKAAQAVGMCKSWEAVDQESPMVPMVVLVSQSSNPEANVQSRLFLDNRCHTAMAGTGAICTTACSRICGSVVHQYLSESGEKQQAYQIQHPSGIMPTVVKTKPSGKSLVPEFETLSFIRTSRRILDGRLYVPEDVKGYIFGDKVPINGTNGVSTVSDNTTVHATNGLSDKSASDDTTKFITSSLADFAVEAKFEDLGPETISTLKLLILDFIGVIAGATQHSPSSVPFLKGIQDFVGHGTGTSTVIAQGQKLAKPYAALLNGATAHSLDFDDTHARAAMHPGVSVLAAAFAEAEAVQIKSSQDFFTAIAVGYEVACRIGMALGGGGHERGFHNTATAGIFGAVACISKLRGLDSAMLQSAWGLALSKAGGTMQYLVNGSWNKRLHPGFAAHDAFLCLSLAEAGAIGAAEPIEGKHGLLNLFSSTPNPSLTLSSLGKEWVFLGTSIKPYPSCRMTHGAMELAFKASEENKGRAVKTLAMKISKAFIPIVGAADQRKLRPQNVVDAQFSIYYQTAIAWLYGPTLGQAAYDHLQDQAVLGFIKKITVVADESFSRMQVAFTVEWEDGQTGSWGLQSPSGEPGNPIKWDTALAKYSSVAGPVYGDEISKAISDVVSHLDEHDIKDLTDLYG